MSFQRDVLDRATPALRIVDDPTPAQVRVRIGDLSQAKIRNWINQLYFDRAKQTTNGNLLLVHAAEQQLGLKPKDAKYAVEQIIDAELICTLGGKYSLVGEGDERRWATSALGPDGQPVEPFQAPIISWFRGLQSHLTRDGSDAIVRAELLMIETPAGIPGIGPILKAIGGDKPAKTKPGVKNADDKSPASKKPDAKKGRAF